MHIRLWISCGGVEQWLGFSSDPDHHADYPIRNPAITQQMSGFWWKFQGSSAMIFEGDLLIL